ncbi:hypothetical protein EYZ11_013299 [Aspergillus tanneri]|uniref:Uncharacterized protein n=1 Tax=Aspergillus tanneri TaxID=1220188 RepID=A0A4S3J050_9EURO|nr:hypothetical protein EYZ11_013299 [Aspergillus tanneri]
MATKAVIDITLEKKNRIKLAIESLKCNWVNIHRSAAPAQPAG